MSSMFSTVSTIVDSHPAAATHGLLAKRSPIIFFEDVKYTNGAIEIGSATHRNTWE